MSSFNNIDKFVYTKNKDDVVSLLEYIIFNDERNREKYIVFKFQNNIDQRLNSIRFEITQYNALGDMLVKSLVEFNPNNVKGYTSFVPDAKFKAHHDCAKITIVLEQAVFERVYYENGKLNPITYSKNDFRNDFSNNKALDEQAPKAKEPTPKLRKRDNKANNTKRRYKIKDITKANKSKAGTIISVILAFLILGYFIGFGIYTKLYETVFTIDGIDYREEDNETLSIVGFDSNAKYIEIPEYVLEKKVVEIEEGAFKNSKITGITFSSSIAIGDEAFKNCKYLSMINNSGYVTRVGNSAFENCISLSNVYFNNAAHVGNRAFAGCIGVEVFSLDNAVVYSEAFLGTEPTSITLMSTNPNKFVKLFGDVPKVPSTLRRISIGQTYFPSGYCEGLDSVYQFITTGNNPTFEEGALDGIQSYEIRDGFAWLDNKIVGVDPNCKNFEISYNISDIDGAFEALKTASNIEVLRLGGTYGTYYEKHFNNIAVKTLVISSDCSYIQDNALQRIYAENIIFETEFDSLRCFGPNYTTASRIEHNGPVVHQNEFTPFTNANEIYIREYTDYIPEYTFINNHSLEVLSIPVVDNFSLSSLGVSTTLHTLNIVDGYRNYLPTGAISGYYNLFELNISPSYYEAYDNFISNCYYLETLVLPCENFIGCPIGEEMYSLRNVEISCLGNFGYYAEINRSNMYTENLTINTKGGCLPSEYFSSTYNLKTLTINDPDMFYDYNFLYDVNLQTLDCINFTSSLSSGFTVNDFVGTIIIRDGTFMLSSASGIRCGNLVLNMDVKYITFNYAIKASSIYLEQLKSSSNIMFETSFSKSYNGIIYCPGIAPSSLKSLCNNYPNINYYEGVSYLN